VGTFTGIMNGNGPFTIGQTSGFYFAGNVDDARVYNRALSDTEIKQLYNAGR